MQTAQELSEALSRAIAELSGIGVRAAGELGGLRLAGYACTASELLRPIRDLVVEAAEKERVPFDKPKPAEKRERKPRAAKAAPKPAAPDPRQTTIAANGSHAPGEAE